MESEQRCFIPAIDLNAPERSVPNIGAEGEAPKVLTYRSTFTMRVKTDGDACGVLSMSKFDDTQHDVSIVDFKGLDAAAEGYRSLEDSCFMILPFDEELDEMRSCREPVIFGDTVRLMHTASGLLLGITQQVCDDALSIVEVSEKWHPQRQSDDIYNDRRTSVVGQLEQQSEAKVFQHTAQGAYRLCFPEGTKDNEYTAEERNNPYSLHALHPRFHFKILPARKTKTQGQVVGVNEEILLQAVIPAHYLNVTGSSSKGDGFLYDPPYPCHQLNDATEISIEEDSIRIELQTSKDRYEVNLGEVIIDEHGKVDHSFCFVLELFDAAPTMVAEQHLQLVRVGHPLMLYHKDEMSYLSFYANTTSQKVKETLKKLFTTDDDMHDCSDEGRSVSEDVSEGSQYEQDNNEVEGALQLSKLMESEKMQHSACCIWVLAGEDEPPPVTDPVQWVSLRLQYSEGSTITEDDIINLWSMDQQVWYFDVKAALASVSTAFPKAPVALTPHGSSWHNLAFSGKRISRGLPCKGGFVSTCKLYRIKHLCSAGYLCIKRVFDPAAEKPFSYVPCLTTDITNPGTLFVISNFEANEEDNVYPLSFVRLHSAVYPVDAPAEEKLTIVAGADGKVSSLGPDTCSLFREAFEVLQPEQSFYKEASFVRSMVPCLTRFSASWSGEKEVSTQDILAVQRALCKLIVFCVEFEEESLQNFNSESQADVIKVWKAEGRSRSSRQKLLFDFQLQDTLLQCLTEPFRTKSLDIQDVANSSENVYYSNVLLVMNLAYKLLVAMLRNEPTLAIKMQEYSVMMLSQVAAGIEPGPMLCLMEMYRDNEQLLKVIPRKMVARVLNLMRDTLNRGQCSVEFVCLLQSIVQYDSKGYYRTQRIVYELLMSLNYEEGEEVFYVKGDVQHVAAIHSVLQIDLYIIAVRNISYEDAEDLQLTQDNGVWLSCPCTSRVLRKVTQGPHSALIDNLMPKMRIKNAFELQVMGAGGKLIWMNASELCRSRTTWVRRYKHYYEAWLELLSALCDDNSEFVSAMAATPPISTLLCDLQSAVRHIVDSSDPTIHISLRSASLRLLIYIDMRSVTVPPPNMRSWSHPEFEPPSFFTFDNNLNKEMIDQAIESLRHTSGLNYSNESELKTFKTRLTVISASMPSFSAKEKEKLLPVLLNLLDSTKDYDSQAANQELFRNGSENQMSGTRFQLTERSRIVFDCKLSILRLIDELVEEELNKKMVLLLQWFRGELDNIGPYPRQDWFIDCVLWNEAVGSQSLSLPGLEQRDMLANILDLTRYDLPELKNKALALMFRVFSVPRALAQKLRLVTLLTSEKDFERLRRTRELMQLVRQVSVKADNTIEEQELLCSRLRDLGSENYLNIDAVSEEETANRQTVMSGLEIHLVLINILSAISVVPNTHDPLTAGIVDNCLQLLERYCSGNLKHQEQLFPEVQSFMRFLALKGVKHLSPLLGSILGDSSNHAIQVVLMNPKLIMQFVTRITSDVNPSGELLLRPRYPRLLKSLCCCNGMVIKQNVVAVANEMWKKQDKVFPPLLANDTPARSNKLLSAIMSGDYWFNKRGIIRYFCEFAELTGCFAEVEGVRKVFSLPDVYYVLCGTSLDGGENQKKHVFPLHVQSSFLKVLTYLIHENKDAHINTEYLRGDIMKAVFETAKNIDAVQAKHRRYPFRIPEDPDSEDLDIGDFFYVPSALLAKERKLFLVDALLPFLRVYYEKVFISTAADDSMDMRIASQWAGLVCFYLKDSENKESHDTAGLSKFTPSPPYIPQKEPLTIELTNQSSDSLTCIKDFLNRMRGVCPLEGCAPVLLRIEEILNSRQQQLNHSKWANFHRFSRDFSDQVVQTNGANAHNTIIFCQLALLMYEDPDSIKRIAQILKAGRVHGICEEVLFHCITLVDSYLKVSLPSVSKRKVLKETQDVLDNFGITVATLDLYEQINQSTKRSSGVSPLSLLRNLLKYGNSNVQLTIYNSLRMRSFPTLFVLIREEFRRMALFLKMDYARYEKIGIADDELVTQEREVVYTTIIELLQFLQLLCEGHYAKLQKYLKVQPGKLFSMNVVKETAVFMRTWFENIIPLPGNIKIGWRGFQTLTEFCQGPSPQNQLCLIENGMISIASDVVTEKWQCPKLKTALRDLGTGRSEFIEMLTNEAVTMLLSLTEGASGSTEVPKLLYREISAQVHQYIDRLNESWISGAINKELEMTLPDLDWDSSDSDDSDNEEDDSNYLALNMLMFLLSLCRAQEAHYPSGSTEVPLRVLLKRQMCYSDLKQHIGCIEVKRVEGKDERLEQVYFPVPARCKFLPDDVKEKFNENVQRRVTDSDDREELEDNISGVQDIKKIQDFFKQRDTLIVETNTYYRASKSRMTRMFIFHKAALSNVSLVISFAISLFLLINMTKKHPGAQNFLDRKRYHLFVAMAVLQIFMEVWMLFGWCMIEGRLIVHKHMHNALKTATEEQHLNSDTLSLYEQWVQNKKDNKLPFWKKIRLSAPILKYDKGLWVCVLFASSSPLGLAVNPIFFSVQIFRIINRNAGLKNVVKAVTLKWQDLLTTGGMGFLVVYLFSMVSFYFFSSKYYDTYRNPDLGIGFRCQELGHCFAMNLMFGLRMDGGVSGSLMPPLPFEGSYWGRIIWDFLFWVIMIIIFLNIIFGIILDTFKELRSKKQERELDMASSCFICGREASTFDKIKNNRDSRRGFEVHYQDQHNQWTYLYFIHYL